MFINYLYRHGWRYSLAALGNFLLLVVAFAQIAVLIAFATAHPFYQEMSERNGFSQGPVFGSWLATALLTPASMGLFAALGIALFAKEWLVRPLRKRAAFNAIYCIAGSILIAFLIWTLYITPMTGNV